MSYKGKRMEIFNHKYFKINCITCIYFIISNRKIIEKKYSRMMNILLKVYLLKN